MKPPKHIDASSTALNTKKMGAGSNNDFQPISLMGSIYMVSAKLLVRRLQKVLPRLISLAQGAFIHGRQILDGVLIANEGIAYIQGTRKEG